MHLFYKDNKQQLYDNEFNASQAEKMQESQRQIEIWQSAPNHCKESALNNIITYIKQYPDDLYVSTTSGEPEINKLLIVSERYCYDVIKNHHQWFIMSSNSYGRTYSMPVQELKDRFDLLGIIKNSVSAQEGIKKGLPCVVAAPKSLVATAYKEIVEKIKEEL